MNRKIGFILSLIIIIGISVIYFLYKGMQTFPSGGYVNGHLLVEGEWVLYHLNDPTVRIIDVRDEEEYIQGHIENAARLELKNIRATVNGVRGMVASKEDVETVFGELGLSPEMTVVIYDKGDSLDAARVFWTFEYYGHQDVRILNGGWGIWTSKGNPISVETPAFEEKVYSASVMPELLATSDNILEKLSDSNVVILDVRSPLEYNGIDIRSKRGGHIPGAVNMEWKNTLNPDGTFRSSSYLLDMYQEADVKMGKDVIVYCQTGHRAAHGYFTMRLLGYDVRLYDGSWEEWGNREDLPIE